MEIRGFTLRIMEGFELNIGMPVELAKRLAVEDEKRLERPFDVLEMGVEERGFQFVLASDTGEPAQNLYYQPEHFDAFLGELAQKGAHLALLFQLDTAGAAAVLRVFSNWSNQKQAEVFEREISAGNMTFEEAREVRPEVFDVPAFQRFHAQLFKSNQLPKAKKGKRAKYRREVEELYALASRIYRETPGLSWESACYSATEQRPDLVPPSWRADPDGNLKREAARYWDKSRYSQLSYRQNRDR